MLKNFFKFGKKKKDEEQKDTLENQIEKEIEESQSEIDKIKAETEKEIKETAEEILGKNRKKSENKDKNLKRNSRLVKYVLELIYSYTQNDTSIISNEVTLEHLKSDDGTLENSSIWNITLTNEEINSNILKNKPILEKIEIS